MFLTIVLTAFCFVYILIISVVKKLSKLKFLTICFMLCYGDSSSTWLISMIKKWSNMWCFWRLFDGLLFWLKSHLFNLSDQKVIGHVMFLTAVWRPFVLIQGALAQFEQSKRDRKCHVFDSFLTSICFDSGITWWISVVKKQYKL